MEFGDSEVVRKEYDIRILKVGTKSKDSYFVLGHGPTLHFDDYDDALEEFNKRWFEEKFKE